MTRQPRLSPRLRRRAAVPGTRAPNTLVALGDVLLDVVVAADATLQQGTDVPATVRFRVGGSAANTARAFRRLGGRATFIGSVGRDDLGRRLVAALRAEGVRVHVVRARLPTGRLVAVVERGGERSFLTERAAANELRADDIRPAWLRGCGVLHIPAYSLFNDPLQGAALRAAGLAHGRSALVSVDVASRGPLLALGRDAAWARLAASGPDILLANRAEAIALAGARGLDGLLDLAPVVIVKEGVEGCRILARASHLSDGQAVSRQVVATAPIVAADTTGAGDAFAAGFLKAILAAGGASSRPWSAALLRQSALAGHRSAADLLRRRRVELAL